MPATEEVYYTPRYAGHVSIERDEKVCIGCNQCVEACMNDVHAPNPEAGGPPIVLHPDDCWYCGCCLMECPLREEGALKFSWPIEEDLRWKRKGSGELFRVGMTNPPAPNMTPPVGGWIVLRDSKY